VLIRPFALLVAAGLLIVSIGLQSAGANAIWPRHDKKLAGSVIYGRPAYTAPTPNPERGRRQLAAGIALHLVVAAATTCLLAPPRPRRREQASSGHPG
jgi:hypothetical protein